MQYLEALDVEVDFNEDTEIIDPDGISFSVRSSIYSLLPTFTMEIEDATGVLQELMYFIHGSSVAIRMGYAQGKSINSTYRVIGENLNELKFPGTLSGVVSLNGVHDWHSMQEVKSTAYRDSGSGVISTLAGGYPFKGSYIESTSGEHVWYQPLIDDVEMIEDVIVPNSTSSVAGNSPFFAWIDARNRFTFQSANELVKTTKFDRSTITLEYYPDSSATKDLGFSTIFSLRRLHDTRDDLRENMNINFFSIDRADGTLQKDKVTAYDIIPQGKSLLPSIGSIKPTTKAVNLNYTSLSATERRINQAEKAYEQVNTLFHDRFFLIVQFNPQLSAGGRIDLRIHTALQADTDEYSQFFSGNYVIESCEHTWQGQEKRAYTLLTVGRRYANVPARNAFKERLIKR